MSEYVIGIDPDSKAHGVAVYEGGNLKELHNMTLFEFYDHFLYASIDKVHIENVCGNNAVFAERRGRANFNTIAKMSNGVGRCQQSQIEIERLLERWGVDVVRHKVSKAWKKDKKQFELATGWTGRSNEDTRSAAYFGFLGCR